MPEIYIHPKKAEKYRSPRHCKLETDQIAICILLRETLERTVGTEEGDNFLENVKYVIKTFEKEHPVDP